MKSHNNSLPAVLDPKGRSCLRSLLIILFLFMGTYLIRSALFGRDSISLSPELKVSATQRSIVAPHKCKEKCRPEGTDALPRGIIAKTSNYEMSPLSGPVRGRKKNHEKSLLAVAVGIKQKVLVDQIVKKFLADDFVVMLFHYDGILDQWRDLEWCDAVVHISASNQTKWWFAKRFLHPDIVAEYEYIFLWDEDLGVDHFHPKRYIDIAKEEGLEISQPALDPRESKVHHHITVRNRRSKVHRRYYRFATGGSGRCDGNSTAPPCVGWVEMMAPVFSRSAWRCAWYMIQNDLIHAWGLDMQLGYCAQGDRTVKVGVIDEEYIAHLGLPTLGGLSKTTSESSDESSSSKSSSDVESQAHSDADSSSSSNRFPIRLRSYAEMRIFRSRWSKAVKEDTCWVDPFQQVA